MERYDTIKEIAEFLSVSPKTIYHWTHEEFIPHYKIRLGVRFKLSEIEAWMKRRRRNGRNFRRAQV